MVDEGAPHRSGIALAKRGDGAGGGFERVGPELGAIEIDASVPLARLDLGVLPPLVPARDNDPVGAGVDRLRPLIVVHRAGRSIDDARRLAIDEVAVVEYGRDRR